MQGNTPWKTWHDCCWQIEEIPGLAFLVQDPFVLNLVVEALPEALRGYLDSVPRLGELYRIYIDQLFARQQKELTIDKDLRSKFWKFSQELAQQMQEKGIYNVFYEESPLHSDSSSSWKPFFNQSDPELALVCKGCPLRKEGNQWSFIHPTLLEFFSQKAIYSHAACYPKHARNAVELKLFLPILVQHQPNPYYYGL